MNPGISEGLEPWIIRAEKRVCVRLPTQQLSKIALLQEHFTGITRGKSLKGVPWDLCCGTKNGRLPAISRSYS
jgi:hypothetical protein